MNSKERVLKTIAHIEPDRVPIGEWGIDHDSVSDILGRHTYWRNRKDTTLALWDGRRDEVVEGLKRDYAELVEKLDHDLLVVGLVPPKGFTVEDPPRKVEQGLWRDSEGRRYKHSASNDSIMCLDPPPAKEKITDQDIEAVRRELLDVDESQFELLDFIADRFADTRAVVFRGVKPYEPLMEAFGGDEAHHLMLSVVAPKEIKKLHDVVVAYNELLLDHCAEKGVLIAMQGVDWGTTTGLMISPQSIRELFMPISKRIVEYAVKLGLIPFFHCCGCIWDILDEFVEAGFVAYQSIQASAGMDWAKVKARYGDKLTLWCGVQCETLIQGTLQEVEAEVRQALANLMPGGGFIFGSTNTVQYGAKTENYLKALETVRKYGNYR